MSAFEDVLKGLLKDSVQWDARDSVFEFLRSRIISVRPFIFYIRWVPYCVDATSAGLCSNGIQFEAPSYRSFNGR